MTQLSPSLSVCLSLSIAALLTLESRHSSLFSASLHLSPSISLVSASSSLSVDLSRLSLSLSAFLSSSDPSCSHSLDDAQTLSSSRRPSYALSQGHHSQGHHLSLSFDQTHIELSLLLHRRRLSSSLVSSTDDAVQVKVLSLFFHCCCQIQITLDRCVLCCCVLMMTLLLLLVYTLWLERQLVPLFGVHFTFVMTLWFVCAVHSWFSC